MFGALRDKDIGSVLTVLQKDADALILTRPKGDRAADPSWVDEVIRPIDGDGRGSLKSWKRAMRQASSQACR